MYKIWKYILQPETTLSMPVGAKVLTVAAQGHEICLWALVNPAAPIEERRFVVFGTGHSVPPAPMTYHGTAHLADGALVFHVFELLGPLTGGL